MSTLRFASGVWISTFLASLFLSSTWIEQAVGSMVRRKVARVAEEIRNRDFIRILQSIVVQAC